MGTILDPGVADETPSAQTNGVGGRYYVSPDEWARDLTDSDLVRRLDGLFQVTGEGLSPAMWKELRRRFFPEVI